jgi:predicted ATP-grasp superfamily ATP-dependent carboligase
MTNDKNDECLTAHGSSLHSSFDIRHSFVIRGAFVISPAMTSDLVIIGASARAAAASARRAGLRPWCADLFADEDLRCLGPTVRVATADYPQGLLAALTEAPPAPLLYTGGLENYPDVLARSPFPLWGNSPPVLRRVRSPFLLARRLRARGLPCPAVRAAAGDDRRWLLKPRRSSGGLGIRLHDGASCNPRTHYLQEWLDGDPCAAVFLGWANGQADLLGVTRQLIGTPWLHARGYLYAGSVGPLLLSPSERAAWLALGDVLVGDFGLRGLFGVDAILRDGVPWPVEVNPRYTASVEILERGLGQSLLALHAAVFTGQSLLNLAATRATVTWGKAILYARQDLIFPAMGPWHASLETPGELPLFADIPAAGAHVAAGRPVMTLFAADKNEEACLARLQETAAALDRRLWA